MKTNKTELHKSDKRPIAKFYRCWLEDVANGVSPEKCRGINHVQFRAADRISGSYQQAYGKSNGGQSFIKISAIKNYCPRDYQVENRLQAVSDYQKVFRQLGKKSAEIIEHFCLLELPLRQYELRQIPQWPKGVGSARLREALDDLIEIYRRLG